MKEVKNLSSLLTFWIYWAQITKWSYIILYMWGWEGFYNNIKDHDKTNKINKTKWKARQHNPAQRFLTKQPPQKKKKKKKKEEEEEEEEEVRIQHKTY